MIEWYYCIHRFGEFPQESPEVATGRPRLPQWQARKSLQESLKAQGGGSSGGQVSEQQASMAAHQPLLSQSTDTKEKSPPSSPSQVRVTVAPGYVRIW